MFCGKISLEMVGTWVVEGKQNSLFSHNLGPWSWAQDVIARHLQQKLDGRVVAMYKGLRMVELVLGLTVNSKGSFLKKATFFTSSSF